MRFLLVFLVLLATAAVVYAFGSVLFTAGAAAGRVLKRVLVAFSGALLGGLLIGTAASFTAVLDPGPTGFLAALALFALLMFREGKNRVLPSTRPAAVRHEMSRQQLDLPHRRRTTRWFPWLKSTDSGLDDSLQASWAALEELEGAGSRVAVVRSSCERVIHMAAADGLDASANEWAIFIRKRVPQLTEAFFREHAVAGSAQRKLLQEELLDALERVGAEAERRCARSGRDSSEFDLFREHITRRTGRNPFDS